MRAVTNRCGDEHQIETTFLSTSTATAVGALLHLIKDYSEGWKYSGGLQVHFGEGCTS